MYDVCLSIWRTNAEIPSFRVEETLALYTTCIYWVHSLLMPDNFFLIFNLLEKAKKQSIARSKEGRNLKLKQGTEGVCEWQLCFFFFFYKLFNRQSWLQCLNPKSWAELPAWIESMFFLAIWRHPQFRNNYSGYSFSAGSLWEWMVRDVHAVCLGSVLDWDSEFLKHAWSILSILPSQSINFENSYSPYYYKFFHIGSSI